MNTKIIKGTRAVLISANDEQGPFTARLWVNFHDFGKFWTGDPTLQYAKRKTQKGILAVAHRLLGEERVAS